MKNFDIKQRVKLFSYSDFKRLDKLSCFNQDHKIIKDLEYSDSISHRTVEGESQIALIEGDVEIHGNLDLDRFFDEIMYTFFGETQKSIQIIWITGAFKISGTLFTEENEDYGIALIVENDVTAKNIIAGGIGLFFLKDITVSEIFYSRVQGEGPGYFVKGKKEIKIDTDINYIWSIGGKCFSFYEGLSQQEVEQIFIKTPDFLEYDEDGRFYYLDDENLLIEALLSSEILFNSIEDFHRIGVVNNNNVQTWLYEGAKAERDEHHEKTVSCYSKALEMEPDNIEALWGVASAYYSIAEKNEKSELMTNPWELDDIEIEAFSNEEAVKAAKEAIKYFERLFEVNAKKAAEEYEACYLAAETHKLLGSIDKALEYYNQQVKFTNDDYCKNEIKALTK